MCVCVYPMHLRLQTGCKVPVCGSTLFAVARPAPTTQHAEQRAPAPTVLPTPLSELGVSAMLPEGDAAGGQHRLPSPHPPAPPAPAHSTSPATSSPRAASTYPAAHPSPLPPPARPHPRQRPCLQNRLHVRLPLLPCPVPGAPRVRARRVFGGAGCSGARARALAATRFPPPPS